MKRPLKYLHIVAAIGLVGALFVSLLLAATAQPASPAALAALRAAIAQIGSDIALPALILLGLSGALLVVAQPLLIDARWVWAKAVLGLLLGAVAIVVVQPAVNAAAALAASAYEGTPSDRMGELLRAESIGSLINLALALVAIALAVWRPGLGRRRED